MASAFRQVAILLRRVGLFAAPAQDFVLVNLTMTFGAGPAPGDFEPLGDVILKIIIAVNRGEDKNLGDSEGSNPPSTAHIRETHLPSGRFVDDVFSSIAMFGNRCGEH